MRNFDDGLRQYDRLMARARDYIDDDTLTYREAFEGSRPWLNLCAQLTRAANAEREDRELVWHANRYRDECERLAAAGEPIRLNVFGIGSGMGLRVGRDYPDPFYSGL